jgi:hypothetical protein
VKANVEYNKVPGNQYKPPKKGSKKEVPSYSYTPAESNAYTGGVYQPDLKGDKKNYKNNIYVVAQGSANAYAPSLTLGPVKEIKARCSFCLNWYFYIF